MERPTIDATAAVFQAGSTVHTYLHKAVEIIDDLFGTGYAAAHPELVAECIRSQTLDFNNCELTAALYSLGDQAEELSSTLATAADTVCTAVHPPPEKRHYINPENSDRV